MRLLALDLSTKTGWAILEDARLIAYDTIIYDDFNLKPLPPPFDTIQKADAIAKEIVQVCFAFQPDCIVIEQTNLGRQRYSQKMLEHIHCVTLIFLVNNRFKNIEYMDSSEWRTLEAVKLSEDDKKHNKELRRTKQRGKINLKHKTLELVNKIFDLELKMKNNDAADAMALGLAWFKKNHQIDVISDLTK